MRFILLPLLLLAACAVPTPAPVITQPPPAEPAPAPPPPPPPAPVAWTDGPLTPGTWHWQTDARGSIALFGVVGQPAAFVVRCDLADRTISLTVPGDAASGATLTIDADDASRSLPAATTGAAPPYAGAALPAADGFVDRIAFSRGRFRVRLSGQAAIILPAWPEFARTIEDCRG